MQITFTEQAVHQLQPFMTVSPAHIKLVYDTEGCGCSVNGVPTLWLEPEADPKDRKAESIPFEVSYKPKDEIFFDEPLIIDYRPQTKSYVLKSNNQIYNSFMSVIDKR